MLNVQQFERRLVQVGLLMGDGIGLFLSFLIVQLIRFRSYDMISYGQTLLQGWRFAPIYVVFVVAYYIFDLYEPRHWRSSLFAPLKIVFASLTAALLLFAWFYFIATQTGGVYGRGVLLGAIVGFTGFSLVFRYFVERSQRRRTRRNEWLLIGSEKSYQMLSKEWPRLHLGTQLHWRDRVELTASLDTLEFQLSGGDAFSRKWDGLIVDNVSDERLSKTLMAARLNGQPILSIQSFFEFYCGKVPLHSLDNSWFAFTEGFSIIHSQISSRLKRLADIFISLAMLTFLSPIMLLLCALIKLESRGPALYSQVRVGQYGHTFTMWKFRSMRMDAEKEGAQWAAKNDSRVTILGKWIRKVRLDELPQLWNILKGEMSFIGPRPERPEFTNQLRSKISFYDLRHLVKPGLTGWAQVMYPYGASKEDAYEKLQYDLFYIKNYSFGRDIEIILKTISVVLFGAGR